VRTVANAMNTTGTAVMRPLDYGRSFICNPSPANAVRFWVESRTRIIDAERGTTSDYLQCGSCKSENTFGERDLLYADNYDFMPIFSGDDLLIFRRHARVTDGYRDLKKAVDVWGQPTFKTREAGECTRLETWEQIRDATDAALPIVSQTELSSPETKLRAIIECPVKTMNVSLDRKMYQVDTGPVALPDLADRHEPEIDSLRLAFLVFNAADFADFVIEQPTPVDLEHHAGCEVYHYSNPISMAAENRLYAIGEM